MKPELMKKSGKGDLSVDMRPVKFKVLEDDNIVKQ